MYTNKRVLIAEAYGVRENASDVSVIVKFSHFHDGGSENEYWWSFMMQELKRKLVVPDTVFTYDAFPVIVDKSLLRHLGNLKSLLEVKEGEKLTCIVTEKLHMDYTHFGALAVRNVAQEVQRESLVFQSLFQIAFQLYTLQSCLGFRHKDLHTSNVFVRRLDSERTLQYKLHDRYYAFSTSYIFMLADMFYSSHEKPEFYHPDPDTVEKVREVRYNDFYYLMKRSFGSEKNVMRSTPKLLAFAERRLSVTGAEEPLENILNDPAFEFLRVQALDPRIHTFKRCNRLVRLDNTSLKYDWYPTSTF